MIPYKPLLCVKKARAYHAISSFVSFFGSLFGILSVFQGLEALDLLFLLPLVHDCVQEGHAEHAHQTQQHAQDLKHAKLLTIENGGEKRLVESMGAHEGLSGTSEADGDTDGHKDPTHAHEEACGSADPHVLPVDDVVGLGVVLKRNQEERQDEELEDSGVQSL